MPERDFSIVGQMPTIQVDELKLNGMYAPVMHVGATLWVHEPTGIVTVDPEGLEAWLASRLSHDSETA